MAILLLAVRVVNTLAVGQRHDALGELVHEMVDDLVLRADLLVLLVLRPEGLLLLHAGAPEVVHVAVRLVDYVATHLRALGREDRVDPLVLLADQLLDAGAPPQGLLQALLGLLACVVSLLVRALEACVEP